MKCIYLLSALFGLLLPMVVRAQNVLTVEEHALRPCDKTERLQTEFFDVGNPGTGGVWDFSTLDTSYRKTITEYLGGTDSAVVEAAPHSIRKYVLRNDSLFLCAYRNRLYDIEYSVPVLEMVYPMQFGDTLHTYYSGNGLYCGKRQVETAGEARVSADVGYAYDSNGSMTRNPNRHIGLMEYDSFNNPRLIQFTDGSVTEYVYDASGVKLKALHRTAVPGIEVPYGTVYEHTASTVLSSDSTLYAGPFVLSGDSLRYKYDGGSVLIPLDGSPVKPCFYALDHLGSVRLVVSADGQVIERNDYYPSGCLITENIDGKTVILPYKYNGKELDPMHGLYTYDYGARQYDPATMLWDRMDPLCEDNPEVSPYVYCGDNPVNAIDPNGKEIRIAWNLRKGKNIIQRYFVYKGGKLYYANGQLYTGKIEYVRKVQDSLNKLTKDDFQLAYRVKELENSKEIHTIAIGDSKINGNSNIPLSSYKDKNHLPTGSNTSYNPDAYHAINGIKRSPEVGLAHELLGHAYNTDKGTTDYSVTPTGVARYEVQAVNIENVARAANKEPKRTKYGEAKIPQKELWNTHK